MFKKIFIFSLLYLSVFLSLESEDVLLKDISGIGYTNETSLFSLTFDKKIDINLFSWTGIKNLETERVYGLSHLFNRTGLSYTIYSLFDFKLIPVGYYSFIYKYNNVTYKTNLSFEVKEREEPPTETKLLNVYGNFIGKKSYQVAYFSFYGKGREINLSYIILRDENSNTYVVEVIR